MILQVDRIYMGHDITKQCTIYRGNPSKSPYISIKFDPPQMGNSMTPDLYPIGSMGLFVYLYLDLP